MNILPSSIEGWNTLFQAVSIVLVAGTVLAGFGTIVTGRIVSRNQARDLAQANVEAAKANQGVADTALEIAKAQEETARLTTEAETAKSERAEADKQIAIAKAETTRLTTEAEIAKSERAEADKQIAIAKADATRAKEGIASAEAQSAKASAEVARLQAVVANAEQNRAEAERALLEVQRRTQPRKLTPAQFQQLTDELRQYDGFKLVVVTRVGDQEADDFADQIVTALMNSGWRVAVGLSGFVNPPLYGIIIRTNDEPGENAIALAAALTKIGLEIELRNRPPTEFDRRVDLIVGHKPVL